jgi:hypothetical protein
VTGDDGDRFWEMCRLEGGDGWTYDDSRFVHRLEWSGVDAGHLRHGGRRCGLFCFAPAEGSLSPPAYLTSGHLDELPKPAILDGFQWALIVRDGDGHARLTTCRRTGLATAQTPVNGDE